MLQIYHWENISDYVLHFQKISIFSKFLWEENDIKSACSDRCVPDTCGRGGECWTRHGYHGDCLVFHSDSLGSQVFIEGFFACEKEVKRKKCENRVSWMTKKKNQKTNMIRWRWQDAWNSLTDPLKPPPTLYKHKVGPMRPLRISPWYPKFNGSHFDLPSTSMHRMTGLGGNFVWKITCSHRLRLTVLRCEVIDVISECMHSSPRYRECEKQQWLNSDDTNRYKCDQKI